MSAVDTGVATTAPTELLIAGEWRPAASGAVFGVEDPSTEETFVEVSDAGPQDGAAALDAAVAAAADWAKQAPRERSAILRAGFDEMVARNEELAVLMTTETGKPLAQSRGEVRYAADYLLWYSEEAVRGDGRVVRAPDGSSTMVAIGQPVGPSVLITPWNFPAAMIGRKVGAALAAGCTIVLKPSELAPVSGLAIADILTRAGLPAGVLNVVNTTRPGDLIAPLLADPRTRKVSFTGSTDVGRVLLKQAADNVLRVSMELGGNAPFVVFADADLDAAVEGAAFVKLRNVGAACTAANRFHVEASVAPEFTERLAARLGAMKVGRGLDPDVEVGPLIDVRAVDKVDRLVSDARDRGAIVATGGNRIDRVGHYFEPTVLHGLSPDARVLHEEIFGPVAPVVPFDHEQEAVAHANDTPFGLVAYLYTSDLDRAMDVAGQLETGMVAINQPLVSNVGAPFGGSKQSGLGREGGPEGLEEFLETKYIAVKRSAR